LQVDNILMISLDICSPGCLTEWKTRVPITNVPKMRCYAANPIWARIMSIMAI